MATCDPHLGGYDLHQAVTYVWLGQALLMTIALLGGGFEVGADRAHQIG